jgi:hypothetical protein
MDDVAPIKAEMLSDEGAPVLSASQTASFDLVSDTLSPEPNPAPALMVSPAKRHGFAGFAYAQIAIGFVVMAAAVWVMWATSKIIALENRRVVSVRLSTIVNDFVTAEARSGAPPEQLGVQTRAFMSALDTVLKSRAEAGEVVLVGEAVVASSVPDVTSEVVAELSKVVKLPTAAAMPPAIKPLVPQMPQGSLSAQPAAPAASAQTSLPFQSAPPQAPETVPAQ